MQDAIFCTEEIDQNVIIPQVIKLLNSILKLWRKFLSADIVKVFSLTSVFTLVKMLTGFVSVKIVSIIIGPSGIALLGQLNSFSTMMLNLASGGITNGIIKYVSEYKNDNIVKQYISTAYRITLYCSIFVGICLLAFHRMLSNWIMLSPQYGYVFIVFGVTILLYAFNNLLLSVLNGYKEYKLFVKINIVNSILGLLFTVALVYFFQLKGALISAVTFQSVMFFATLWMARKLPWMKKDFFLGKLESPVVKKYLQYALMCFVSTATIPVAQLILRGHVISNISDVHAGWWEAMNRISGMYLMVITSSFGVYYLPRLSELETRAELRHEIFKAYKVIVPILIAGFSAIYFLREFVIYVLFTKEFQPMERLFIWQLASDFFKIASWLLAFLMVAKSMTKTYIATDILFPAFHVGLSFLMMKTNGVVGITQSSFVSNVLYLITMMVIFRKIIFLKFSS